MMKREFDGAILIQADVQAPRMPWRRYTKEEAIRIQRTIPRHMQAEGTWGHVKHALITDTLMGLYVPKSTIQEALAKRQPTSQE